MSQEHQRRGPKATLPAGPKSSTYKFFAEGSTASRHENKLAEGSKASRQVNNQNKLLIDLGHTWRRLIQNESMDAIQDLIEHGAAILVKKNNQTDDATELGQRA